MEPRHPVYIVSKGRADSSLTSRSLHRLGVAHFVVVEEQEVETYATSLESSATVLVLDKRHQDGYETCDDLGDSRSKGPGPARNFAWAHSMAGGSCWHWVMDDNIEDFYRVNQNLRVQVSDGTIFRCMEDFVERYRNVAMAGPNYWMFVPRREHRPPFITNTRIYSCNLIRNDLSYRWRGRYNEDTDLSLRMLKDGWCTVRFNAFIQNKMRTQAIAGGNTAEFYAKEGTLPKSRMLASLHPDVAKLAWRFGREHHLVDYRPFRKNRLKRKPGVVAEGVNDYGMVFQRQAAGQWV